MKKIFIAAAAVMTVMSLNAKVLTVGDVHPVKGTFGGVDRPCLSADGSFVVAQTQTGLEKIDLNTGASETLVKGNSLSGIRISDDGATVAYTRPSYDDNHLRYVSVEAVNTETRNVETIVAPSRDLASGISVRGGEVRTVRSGKVSRKAIGRNTQGSVAPVVAIDRGHLTVDGAVLDPQGKGSYLWPSLSPDGTRIAYWLVGYGCFVCDLDGGNIVSLGLMRAPVWAGNDVVIGMNDVDDGEFILSSSLVAADIATGEHQTLTADNVVAMYPSATAERVTFVDADGNLFYFDINR